MLFLDGSTKLLDYFLRRTNNQVYVAETDSKGNTALHIACMRDFAISEARKSVFTKLLANGCSPLRRNKAGMSPSDLLSPVDWRRQILSQARAEEHGATERARDEKKYHSASSGQTKNMRSNATASKKPFQTAKPWSKFKIHKTVGIVENREQLLKLIASMPEKRYEHKVKKSVNAEEKANCQREAVGHKEVDKSVRTRTKRGKKALRQEPLPAQATWEVRCTVDVWKYLKHPKSARFIAKQAKKKLEMLANGEFRPRLCRPIQGVPPGIMLYETNVTDKVRLIWEFAPAFSPNLSRPRNISENEFRGHHVFCEIIRVWSVVIDHDSLDRIKEKIVKSHKKAKSVEGKLSLVREGGNDDMAGTDAKSLLQRKREKGPCRFSLRSDGAYDCSPPANPDDRDFGIIKFYPLTAGMISLHDDEYVDVDFLFDVNPDEFEIINADENLPILLLGRSGTGKTTCCLYRMWRSFQRYWRKTSLENPLYQCTYSTQTNSNDEAKEALFSKKRLTSKSDSEEHRRHDDEHLVRVLPPRVQRNALAEIAVTADVDSTASLLVTKFGFEEKTSLPASDTSETYHHLQQVFITKNPLLCNRMRKCFMQLCHADACASFHREYEKEPLPFSLQNFNVLQFPCFLTMRQWLFLLDASLPSECFFDRDGNGAMLDRVSTWGDNDGLLKMLEDDWNDDDDDNDDNEHLINYDEDTDEAKTVDVSSHLANAVHRTAKFDDDTSRIEITYSYFANNMWSKISRGFSDYDASLVWTEIKSFIKGSVEALNSSNCRGYLEKEDYFRIGRKRAPTFESCREDVYEMFLRYQTLKKQRRAFDECDLVFNLYTRLSRFPSLDWTVNQLFVDEIQDFTQAEIALLMRCCQNPNGVFATGDTAQSIMRGVSFRFKDMQMVFHHRRQTSDSSQKIEIPRVSRLHQNYRSHSGILEVASSVVELMERYFKESFDLLPKDRGLFPGPKPSYIESTSVDSLALMLLGNKRKTSSLEFGAHQVILVRSEEALNALPGKLKCAIAMTIFDAKGLEFDDVLLYNFFTDSKVSKAYEMSTVLEASMAFLCRLIKSGVFCFRTLKRRNGITLPP